MCRDASRSIPGARRAIAAAVVAASVLLAAGPVPAHAAGTSTISGTAFQDVNRNGIRDAGEQPFASVRINLFDASGSNIAATYTDSNGTYTFAGLADGSYTVAFDPQSWWTYRADWVMTNHPSVPAPGYLRFQDAVSLSGSAAADFPLRPIVRSTTYGSPITTLTTPAGTLISSYDDVVTAQQVYSVLETGHLFGAEQPNTSMSFDFGSANETTTTVGGTQGSYYGYTAQIWVQYLSWLDSFDDLLFHEWGHAWSEYCMYLIQQDSTLSAYLSYRGLLGNPNLGTSHMWEPTEMIAEDYRQLFGSATAAAYPQENTQIPPASQVPGLSTWLATTFTQPPYAQPIPAVSSLSPSAGPAAGGTAVTVTGSNFTGAGWTVQSVSFGGAPASSYTVNSSTQIVAVAPPGSATANVTVTTVATANSHVETSAVTAGDVFSWVPVPTVTGLSPSSGPMKGGTSVTVTGTGFSGPGFTTTSVLFGSVHASFTVTSPTTVVAVSPPSKTLQGVTVTVTTPGGTSSANAAPATTFTYTRK